MLKVAHFISTFPDFEKKMWSSKLHKSTINISQNPELTEQCYYDEKSVAKASAMYTESGRLRTNIAKRGKKEMKSTLHCSRTCTVVLESGLVDLDNAKYLYAPK